MEEEQYDIAPAPPAYGLQWGDDSFAFDLLSTNSFVFVVVRFPPLSSLLVFRLYFSNGNGFSRASMEFDHLNFVIFSRGAARMRTTAFHR
jgi:hypothetical protein